VTLIVVVMVIVAAAITVRSVWKRRHAAPIRGVDRVRQPGLDGQEFYAPSFIVVPGQCFRLCRDPDTGTAFPCDNQVEGSGNFDDHRGNPVKVESCGAHRSILTNWEFRQLR
jgi:hypothetical protein